MITNLSPEYKVAFSGVFFGGRTTAQTPFLGIKYSSLTDSVNLITIIIKMDDSEEPEITDKKMEDCEGPNEASNASNIVHITADPIADDLPNLGALICAADDE